MLVWRYFWFNHTKNKYNYNDIPIKMQAFFPRFFNFPGWR